MSQGPAQTLIVTGASQGIGAAVAQAFLARGYNVVASSRRISTAKSLPASQRLVLVDGDIAQAATARRIAAAALDRFSSIDALVNNAGIFFTKPFIEYTLDDFNQLVATNLLGFIHLTRLAVQQMLRQGSGGSVVSITSSMVEHPIAGVKASIPMITKGGLDAVSRSLAMEYAQAGIRVNTVAPGVVDTPLHEHDSQEFLRTLSPMGRISVVQDIVDAVVYLTEARSVTGEVLHVDGGAHLGRW